MNGVKSECRKPDSNKKPIHFFLNWFHRHAMIRKKENFRYQMHKGLLFFFLIKLKKSSRFSFSLKKFLHDEGTAALVCLVLRDVNKDVLLP
jgi:hypothetical protein